MRTSSWEWISNCVDPLDVAALEFSLDYGVTWHRFDLPADFDPYQWATFTFTWHPEKAGTYVIKVRGVNTDGLVSETPAGIIVHVEEEGIMMSRTMKSVSGVAAGALLVFGIGVACMSAMASEAPAGNDAGAYQALDALWGGRPYRKRKSHLVFQLDSRCCGHIRTARAECSRRRTRQPGISRVHDRGGITSLSRARSAISCRRISAVFVVCPPAVLRARVWRYNGSERCYRAR